MSSGALRAGRLRSQLLTAPVPDPVDAVARLTAVQAQDYAAGLWAIGVRTRGATVVSIERAIADRRIVRSWPMRGTLHFVAAADLRWLLALLTPRMISRGQPRLRQLGLSEPDITRMATVLGRELAGAPPATRDELYALLAGNGVSPDGQRGINLLLRLCQEGLLCQGPYRGRQATFTLLDEWLPPTPTITGDEALAQLARRYFTGHGPATVRDLAWWAGLTLTAARVGLAAVRDELAEVVEGEHTYYYVGDAGPGRPGAGVLLLPGFDQYLLGYQDRSLVLDAAVADRIVPGNNGVFRPMVVVGGQIVGTWRGRMARDRVDITIEPFGSAGRPAPIPAAAERYGRFVGRPVEVT